MDPEFLAIQLFAKISGLDWVSLSSVLVSTLISHLTLSRGDRNKGKLNSLSCTSALPS